MICPPRRPPGPRRFALVPAAPSEQAPCPPPRAGAVAVLRVATAPGRPPGRGRRPGSRGRRRAVRDQVEAERRRPATQRPLLLLPQLVLVLLLRAPDVLPAVLQQAVHQAAQL